MIIKSDNYKFPSHKPLILAPLAGVSDFAFRLMCQRGGADLTYVEMLSSTALIHKNKKTLDMLYRHPNEKKLGVQITGRNGVEIAQAVTILNHYHFDTLDINMGCPVKKVVKVGCGSALLKDPDEVYEITRKSVLASDIPVSVKIRLGWDLTSKNFLEVVDAIETGGASWVTVHGRTRSQNYSDPVDLSALAEIKQKISIPLIGNGNLFSKFDCDVMEDYTFVDGFMISRGALGNPWVFSSVKDSSQTVDLDEWFTWLQDHIEYHRKIYSSERVALVCFRKHLLWYMKGWPHGNHVKEKVLQMDSFEEVLKLIDKFVELLISKGIKNRQTNSKIGSMEERFLWNPKDDICLEDYRKSKTFMI